LWAVDKNAKEIDPDDDVLKRELGEIQHAIAEERAAAAGSSYKALLKNGDQRFFYRTMPGIGGQFMQQLSGRSCNQNSRSQIVLTSIRYQSNHLRK
jgi:hypothetical protein